MDKFQHPIIVCPHKLKLSNMELLARDLAIKLNITIQIEDKEGFKITFESPKSSYCTKLKISRTSLIPQLKYEIILKEFKLYIYDDFIETLINFKVDYYHLLDLNKKNDLTRLEFFQDFCKTVSVLGADEIHIGIFEEFGNGKKINYKWRNVLKEISKATHFKIQLSELSKKKNPCHFISNKLNLKFKFSKHVLKRV